MDVPRLVVEAVAPSAVVTVEPCLAGCGLASEPAAVVVTPNNVGLGPDATDVEGLLVGFVEGLVAVSAALSAGLLRFENSPPKAGVAEDDAAELGAAPPKIPNRFGGAPFAEVAFLAPASCPEVAGVAEGRLKVGFDEG